jgi:hypothetical protein
MSARGRTSRQGPPRRGGLFSSMGAPPMESMPPMRTAFARGLVATWSSAVIVGFTVAWVAVEWLVLLALGFPGPFALLAYGPATPPLSTTTDLSVAIGTLGVGLGLPLVLIVAAVHALWQSLLVGLAIEAVESGGASRWGAVRGLRGYPIALAIHVMGVAVLFASQIVSGLGGGSLSLVLEVAIFVLAVWAFSFAPVIAIADGRRFIDSLGRGFRAARLPGSGNLTFATIYVVPVFATIIATVAGATPGSTLDVNPPYTAWIYVVLMNLLHAAIAGAVAMRYLAIADEVPDAPSRGTRSRTDARGGRSR